MLRRLSASRADAAALFTGETGPRAVAGNEEILKETRAIEIAGAVVIS